MTTDERDLPELTLERYRLGELPAAMAARVERLAAADPALRARLAALDASDERIAARYGTTWTPRPGPGGSPDRRRGAAAFWLRMSAAAATVLVLGVAWQTVPGWRPGTPADIGAGRPDDVPEVVASVPAADPDARVKGAAVALLVYRQTPASSDVLASGDSARAGDVVQLAYRSSEPRFGVIVSVDGRGVVTRHLPVTGARAVALETGSGIPLDAAYELDDAPRWEQFILVTSPSSFDVATVLDAARDAALAATNAPPASLRLPDTLEQTTFLLTKTP